MNIGMFGTIIAAGLGVALPSSDSNAYRRPNRQRDHFESEKPLTKRQKRRLKGKSKK